MIDVAVYFYLAAPVFVVAAAVLYGLTRAPDRIQLATVALFATSLIYFVWAYELASGGADRATQAIGFLVGAYALGIYVCMGALALYFKRWAWYAGIVVFALHTIIVVASVRSAFDHGTKGTLVLIASLVIGAVGLWALLHRGTRAAVSSAAVP